MIIQSIQNHADLQEQLKKHKRVYLLLHKTGSDQSRCAMENLQQVGTDLEDLRVLTADVQNVRDIHPVYGIQTVPALMEFVQGEFRNVIKGCQQPGVLKNIFEEAVYIARMEREGKTVKQVTVYSTPSCSWCNTLKNYLRKNKIRFSDVDVSKDEQAARDLVNRTGQQGVPQTEINGQWVVGFDQKRLDQLLEI